MWNKEGTCSLRYHAAAMSATSIFGGAHLGAWRSMRWRERERGKMNNWERSRRGCVRLAARDSSSFRRGRRGREARLQPGTQSSSRPTATPRAPVPPRRRTQTRRSRASSPPARRRVRARPECRWRRSSPARVQRGGRSCRTRRRCGSDGGPFSQDSALLGAPVEYLRFRRMNRHKRGIGGGSARFCRPRQCYAAGCRCNKFTVGVAPLEVKRA
jgi:hypothetical protein